MEQNIRQMLKENIELQRRLVEDFPEKIKESAQLIINCIRNNNKVLLCGNGGSATQCSHIAAEFVGRFKKERKGLPAIALTTNTSNLTAIGNDYGFDKIFERQVEALGNKGDILLAISTSGNSQNVLNAMKKARNNGMKIIGLWGKGGGKSKGIADIEIVIPSDNTPRIQEAHITILHIICELMENELFREE